MHNPAGLFVSFFKQALARQGIKVTGKLRSVNWLDRQAQPLDRDKLVELGSVQSLPMREIARSELWSCFRTALCEPHPVPLSHAGPAGDRGHHGDPGG
jgi:hypothetical protein